jgi:ferrous iron transport protein A
MKLSEVEPQDNCCIVDAAEGHVEIQSRLYTLGLFPGVHVRVLRLAPLGDPMQIKVGNALLSIRRQEADLIQVDKL